MTAKMILARFIFIVGLALAAVAASHVGHGGPVHLRAPAPPTGWTAGLLPRRHPVAWRRGSLPPTGGDRAGAVA